MRCRNEGRRVRRSWCAEGDTFRRNERRRGRHERLNVARSVIGTETRYVEACTLPSARTQRRSEHDKLCLDESRMCWHSRRNSACVGGGDT